MAFFRGATAYEAQVGCLWLRVPYWVFLRIGCLPSMGWEH